MSGRKVSISRIAERLQRVARHADGNVCGRAYGLTSFSPIRPGEAAAVQRHLEDLPVGDQSPLARLKQLHSSRLHVLEELVYQGAPQEPEPLQSAYLIFTASFDGDLEQFLDDICTFLPAEADAIWERCVGYPGTGDPERFRRYIQANQIDNHYFLTPYPDATVADVRKGLALRGQVADFAVRAQAMDAITLRDAFRETFGR